MLRNPRLMRFSSSSVSRQAKLVRMTSIELSQDTASEEPAAIATNLSHLQENATKIRVPWFLEAMPESYFKQVAPERRLRHLVAVAALPDLMEVPEIVSREKDGSTLSILSSGRRQKGKFFEQMKQLGDAASVEQTLKGMNLYTSKDQVLSITEFMFASPSTFIKDAELPAEHTLSLDLKEYAEKFLAGGFETDAQQHKRATGETLHASPKNFAGSWSMKEIERFAFLAAKGLDERVTPRRLFKFMEMYQSILTLGLDEVVVDIESNFKGERNKAVLTLALSNMLIKPTFQRLSKYLESRGLIIERAHLDRVKVDHLLQSAFGSEAELPDYNDVSFIRLIVTPFEDDSSDLMLSPPVWDKMKSELLKTLPQVAKWYDDRIIDLMTSSEMSRFSKDNGLNNSPLTYEVVIGILDAVHLLKSGRNSLNLYEFSRNNISSVLKRPQTFRIAQVFIDRYVSEEGLSDEEFNSRLQAIQEDVEMYIEVDMQRSVLKKMVEIVKNTEKTNAFNDRRFAFALKLKPSVFEPSDLRQDQPFGMFYVNGRRFTGLQVRFREIARGGLRLLTPGDKEVFAMESARQFNECYDLAFAQQLKNKDIAEGGSKAVCLIDAGTTRNGNSKQHIMRKSVKAFGNSLLDLVTEHKKPNGEIEPEEMVFLGPDEQVTVEHINWLVYRAKERGFSLGTAFMSSKPDQGFNHKEFGVTSEGVAVFLDVTLKNLQREGFYKHLGNVDVSEGVAPFTVKITGGPDGDVAGNMLNILHRNYGDKCRVVGLADGTGCVEDPNGISWPELIRLFKESKPLSAINKSALSDTAQVYTLEKAEGVQKRNTMHNRVVSDAFIPGGGRPATINGDNWKRFLDADGNPTSPLIVEGANLFLTAEARRELMKKGCVIIKDSSANKCGVICSSFEIMCSMVFEKEDFLRLKPELVQEVLEKLRFLAQREAQLMMNERNKRKGGKHPVNLVELSIEVSKCVNKVTDAVRDSLYRQMQEAPAKDVLEKFSVLVKEYLPKTLANEGMKPGELLTTRMPEKYVASLISTIVACDLVYNEGVEFINTLEGDALADTAFRYVANKKRIAQLAKRLRDSPSGIDASEAALAADLLELGGPRSSLGRVDL